MAEDLGLYKCLGLSASISGIVSTRKKKYFDRIARRFRCIVLLIFGLRHCVNILRYLNSESFQIQGIIWSILALVALLYYNEEIVFPEAETASYNYLLRYYLYAIYLNPRKSPKIHHPPTFFYIIFFTDGSQLEDTIIDQEVFYIFSWIYFLLSIFWIVASCTLFFSKRLNNLFPVY